MESYNDMSADDCYALERLIDRYSLQQVAGTLACIAADKAVHIETQWQDRATAKVWRAAAKPLDRASAQVARLFAGRK